MSLTLITPTGERPEAWALCQRWMARQTYQGPVRWIIVDDGEKAQDVDFWRPGWDVTVLRPRPHWQPGQNTQARNFRAALDIIGPDAWVAIIEDDDWYSPVWLDRVESELEHAELVGQGWNRYFNVVTGAIKEHDNEQHASLCATAFRGAALVEFRRLCEWGPKLIDMHLWRNCQSKQILGGCDVIGMKGMPGRGGIAGGHRLDTDDPFDLREWVGDDASAYDAFR